MGNSFIEFSPNQRWIVRGPSECGFCYPKIIDRPTSREKLVHPAMVFAAPGPGNRGIIWVSKFRLALLRGARLTDVGLSNYRPATNFIQTVLKPAFLVLGLYL
jgi:hypothetical protein